MPMSPEARLQTRNAAAVFLICLALVLGGMYRQGYWDKPAAPAPAAPTPVLTRVAPSTGVAIMAGDHGTVVATLDRVMGTYAKVTLWDTPPEAAAAAAEDVFALFRELDQQFTTYRDDSELMRLSAAAGTAPAACTPRMWEILGYARTAYADSHGSFDVTVLPMMKMWGFYRKRAILPGPDEVAAVRANVGFDQAVFDDAAHTIRFPHPGFAMDFGGIAKGYAVDLAAQHLTARGIKSALIDLGGNLYCMPTPPPGRESYNVGIRHPRRHEDQVAYLQLRDRAVATSGDYERFVEIGGKRYAHHMDPRTGLPTSGIASVTIVSPKGVTSDYLGTSILVNNGAGMEELLQKYPNTDVLILFVDDQGHLTPKRYGKIWDQLQGLDAPPVPSAVQAMPHE